MIGKILKYNWGQLNVTGKSPMAVLRKWENRKKIFIRYLNTGKSKN